MNRLVAALTLLALVGCSQGDTPPTKPVSRVAQAGQKNAAPVFGLVAAGAAAGTAYEARIREQRAFARLPDRGELLSYSSRGGGQGAMVKGAYTWHRVDVSEEHALRAIVDGRLRVLTPSGQALDIRYDRHIEHPSGDLSWIGHIEGQPGAQTVLTFGADAVYGSIGQPGKRSLRLTTRNGAGWIVETDPTKLAGIAAANPSKPDFLAMPKVRRNPDAKPPTASAPATITAAATTAATTTIDLLVGYTPGFASRGASAAMTRLNQMVTAGNEAFANSQVNAQIRLVHAMQVNYADNTSNDDTLEQLTGYDSDNDRYTTPNAAFNALRAARETYGADLVTLVRAFREPEQDGCGIAWLIGSGMTQVRADDGSDYFGYSVVSDGEDDSYYCRDETLVHELAHNIGSQHDRESAEGGDESLDTDDYGAFSYSFGFKTSAATGNFYTIMAYGDEGQQDYRVFSNPRLTTFCGGRACGSTTYEDNARSLGQLAPTISAFRISAVGGVKADVNGDKRSDLLFQNTAGSPRFTYWLLDGSSVIAYGRSTPIASTEKLVASGDFNGDGYADLVWMNPAGRLALWSGGSAGLPTSYSTIAIIDLAAGWAPLGAVDVNNDGKSDLLFQNKGSQPRFTYWLMNGASIRQYGRSTSLADTERLAAMGDFNGDGYADVVWINQAGRLAMWVGGPTVLPTSFATVGILDISAGWNVLGPADVNRDGKSDLLFQNRAANPRFTYWIMSGARVASYGKTTSLASSERLAASGDMNGDRFADVVWMNPSGRLALWGGGPGGLPSATGTIGSVAISQGWSPINPLH